jgi:AsmA-like C-terminal region
MQSGFWRKCRICVRWLRRAALLALLAALCVIIWFDRVGLPSFFTARLVAALHEHGIDLEFSRIHLSVSNCGLVAENVRMGQGQVRENPSISARQVVLEIDYRAALQRRLQLDGLVIRNGNFFLPLSETNVLAMTNIQTDLQWQTNDVWTLNNLKASFDGIQLGLSGQVLHGSEFPKWEIFHGKTTSNAQAVREQLGHFSEALKKVQFSGPTLLSLNVQGDARDIHSFAIVLVVTAPSVHTAWGDGKEFQFSATLTAPADAMTYFDAPLDFWTNVLPYRLTWTMKLADLKSQMLDAQMVSAAGFWNAPVLAVTNLSSTLGGGQLAAEAQLDVVTREFMFTNSSGFDPHVADLFLTPRIRERFADYSWTAPPQLHIGGSMVFPAWTNLDVDWGVDLQPTLKLNGDLAFTDGTIQGVRVDSMAAQFSYSNLVWRVPLFDFEQFNTRLEASGSEDDATKEYHWTAHGTFDPETLSSFLPPTNATRVLRLLSTTGPLYFSAEGLGRLDDLANLYATGHLAYTNFAFREQHVDSVEGDFAYTNRLLKFYKPQLWRGKGTMTADEITLDFDKKLIWFKNGYSTVEPQVVVAAIGPKTAEIMAPFVFLRAPTALVNGCVPLGDPSGREDTDLRFDVVGGAPFETHKLNATYLTGTVHWLGQHLILTNLVAELYGGSGTGNANFNFKVPHEGADYHCQAIFTNVDLHALISDVSGTNRLQGALSGYVVVTHASTEDWRTVDGYGRANLRDGMLWNVPIFGFVSTALNQVSPGLGNSRATDAGGDFIITNGVIYSDTLQINTGTTRLQYAGTVDLKQNVNAHVTAQLMRNIWGVGPVISAVSTPFTKLFEYKVTGTLDDPKYEPLYVLPKLLLMPLHPIQAVKGIFTGNNSGQTNAPAAPPAQ